MDGDMGKNEISCNPAFKAKVQEKIDEWFGGREQYKLLFQWWDIDTTYTVAQAIPQDGNSPVETIYFLRLFVLGDGVAISEDGKVYPDED